MIMKIVLTIEEKVQDNQMKENEHKLHLKVNIGKIKTTVTGQGRCFQQTLNEFAQFSGGEFQHQEMPS